MSQSQAAGGLATLERPDRFDPSGLDKSAYAVLVTSREVPIEGTVRHCTLVWRDAQLFVREELCWPGPLDAAHLEIYERGGERMVRLGVPNGCIRVREVLQISGRVL